MGYIAHMLKFMDILCEEHPFTIEILKMASILSTHVYKETVTKILTKMMTRDVVFQKVDNETSSYEDPDIEIVSTYNILPTAAQAIITFNKISESMSLDIALGGKYIGIDGVYIGELWLTNTDAIEHALFIYICNKIKHLHELPYLDIFCINPGCIYFRNEESTFCCIECIEGQINPRCIFLREQGKVCSCKLCVMIRKGLL
jgi:hypothetical protein